MLNIPPPRPPSIHLILIHSLHPKSHLLLNPERRLYSCTFSFPLSFLVSVIVSLWTPSSLLPALLTSMNRRLHPKRTFFPFVSSFSLSRSMSQWPDRSLGAEECDGGALLEGRVCMGVRAERADVWAAPRQFLEYSMREEI